MANTQGEYPWNGLEKGQGMKAPDGYFRPISKGDIASGVAPKDNQGALSPKQKTLAPTTPPYVQSPYLHSSPESVSPYEQMLYAQSSLARSSYSTTSTQTSYFPSQPSPITPPSKQASSTQLHSSQDDSKQAQDRQPVAYTREVPGKLVSSHTTPIVGQEQCQSGPTRPPLAKHDSAHDHPS